MARRARQPKALGVPTSGSIAGVVERRLRQGDRAELSSKQKRRIAAALASPEAFAQEYLPEYLRSPSGSFQREMDELMMNEQQVVLVAPRKHAKSARLFFYVMLRICRGDVHYVLWISETDNQAEKFVRRIRRQLERNTKLREDFGDLVGNEQWSKEAIITSTGIRIEPLGTGSAIRGAGEEAWRPDLIVGDDILNRQHSKTKELRESLKEWWWEDIYPAADEENYQYILVNTPQHEDDLVANLEDSEDWASRHWSAITPEGTPLWPEKYTIDRLREIERNMPARSWHREWLCQVVSDDEAIVKRDWIRYYDSDEPLRGLVSATGFDPAISLKQTADRSALVNVRVNLREQTVYVDRIWAGRETVLGQCRRIEETCRETGSTRRLAVESVAYQAALKQVLDQRGIVHATEVKPAAGSTKQSRLEEISTLFERGRVFFRPTHGDLIAEILAFTPDRTGRHDDLADAFVLAVQVSGVLKPRREGVRGWFRMGR